jgi:hypothetical protein
MAAIDTLLDGLVDYAGLFPPASLDMEAMVEQYAIALASERASMVGRIIVPASTLGALEQAAKAMLPGHAEDDPWCVSALVRLDKMDADLEAIANFNDAHELPEHGLALIDTIEVKAFDANDIEAIASNLPEGLFAFVEIPIDSDPRGLLCAIAGDSLGAKVRTGGITPELNPPIEDVARFIVHAVAAEVPYKATAGLHHPLPNDNPDIPARQLGFVNVFAAAALARVAGLDQAAVEEVLSCDDPEAFVFDGATLQLADYTLTSAQLEVSRLTSATSFGSCSLDDPWNDLIALGWLVPEPVSE